MIIKMTEWAGMMLISIMFARLVMMVTNTDKDDVWDKTEVAEKKAMNILKFSNPRF